MDSSLFLITFTVISFCSVLYLLIGAARRLASIPAPSRLGAFSRPVQLGVDHFNLVSRPSLHGRIGQPGIDTTLQRAR